MVALCVCTPQLASARDEAPTAGTSKAEGSSEATERWLLGAGAGVSLGLARQEVSGDSEISSSLVFGELTVAPMYNLTPRVALGLHLSWASDFGARGLTDSAGDSVELALSLWQLALAGRYQAEPAHGWYLGGQAGVAAAVDSVGEDSATQWAPFAAVAVGCDFRLTRGFALGVELRGALAWFAEDGSALSVGNGLGAGVYRYDYGTTGWFGLNVLGHFVL